MLRHQGAILRWFIKKKDYKYNIYLGAYKYIYLGGRREWPLYVFDSDMDAHVNGRRGVRDCLVHETVVTIQRVQNLVEMFLRPGEFIRYQEVFKVPLVSSGSW